ncbi:hypothetical protein ACFVT5_21135 [Streptomyces sp. NPDC058001]|uniref:hypothetical protein n=1 Tax=Streptomyces sp. NPDC058001 TaxID=3346300 RepID=UPI0036E0ACCF
MKAPRARREGLRVKTIAQDGRLAVYDEHAEQGHLLSPLCATVFHLTDGTRTLPELTTAVAREHPTADTTLVRHALTELNTARLLDIALGEPDRPRPRDGAVATVTQVRDTAADGELVYALAPLGAYVVR